MTFSYFRAPLLMAVLAIACKRSPGPPSPVPSVSATGSARAALSSSPSGSASSPPGSASAAPVAPPSCADWTVHDRGATGSLAHWCQHFGPCPESLQQGVVRNAGRFPTIQASGDHRVLRSGFLGGRSYTFERGRLVGAQVWDDGPFGTCAERFVTTYTGGSAVSSSAPGASCGVVPGRDYTQGEPCRCHVEARKPTLVDGNRGPPLRTSLECLYEVGVAAHLCQRTLPEQQELVARLDKEAKGHAQIAAEMRRARGAAPPSPAEKTSLAQAAFRSSERAQCGGTVISWPFQGASSECRYDAAGALTGLRWGKRYVSEGFTDCPK